MYHYECVSVMVSVVVYLKINLHKQTMLKDVAFVIFPYSLGREEN